MEHDHDHHNTGTGKEYLKLAALIMGIALIANYLSPKIAPQAGGYMTTFMGIFFLTFAFFKLLDLKGFAMSYIGYDLIAKKVTAYAYVYPFVELLLGLGFLLQWPGVEWPTFVIMSVGAIGIGKELSRGRKIKCACLGTYIQLPLSTVSLFEDLTMAIMALMMITK